jgi:hypothetical protein
MLPLLLIVSAVLTAPVALSLLWLYRRAIVRAMRVAIERPHTAEPVSPARGGPTALRVIEVGSTQQDARIPALLDNAMRTQRRAILMYYFAGLTYAAVLAFPWMWFSSGGFPPIRFLWLVSCYSWPIVLATFLQTVPGNRARLRSAGIYLGSLALIGTVALARSRDLTIGQLVFFWLFANGPGTVLLVVFLHWRIRSVGPLVFTFMTVGVTGAFLGIELLRDQISVLWGIVSVAHWFGLGGMQIFVLLHLAGFVAFGVLGWRLLRWIGARYRSKQISEESLNLDAMWLLFAVAQSFTFAFEGIAWMLTGPVGFVVYKLVAREGFARLPRPDHAPVRMLLLLRVFALGRRSSVLFDTLRKHWSRTGSIGLIAGPDLATTTVEPHEFLEFIGGQLGRLFVTSESELTNRLRELDLRSDPDGRFRVNEFFCQGDVWQTAMRRLSVRSDAVLMDLRGFSRNNRGCVYELGALLDEVDLGRVLLIVDGTTDREFFEETLVRLWSGVRSDSPNHLVAEPTVYLFVAREPSLRGLEALLFNLVDTASPVGREMQACSERR